MSRPASFLTLPGEIRNQIIEECILDAVLRCPNKNKRTLRVENPPQSVQQFPYRRLRAFPERVPGIEVSVLPGWNGNSRIKTLGIGSLPLLLVSKQINSEVSSLVDCQVSVLSIGPYGVQYVNEDPNLRWDLTYPQLRNRPYLLKNVQKLEVFLPWLRRDL